MHHLHHFVEERSHVESSRRLDQPWGRAGQVQRPQSDWDDCHFSLKRDDTNNARCCTSEQPKADSLPT